MNNTVWGNWSGTITIQDFWDEQAEWSQKTFGTDTERGPIGPMKHLRKEVQEVLDELELQPLTLNPFNDGMKERLLEEFADCLFLLFDAVRRSGFSLAQLIAKAFVKLAKNKQRVWPKPTSDEPVEHVRGIHD